MNTTDFNISLRFLSRPGAFLDSNNLMSAFVSFSVKGSKFNSLFFRSFKTFSCALPIGVNAISQNA